MTGALSTALTPSEKARIEHEFKLMSLLNSEPMSRQELSEAAQLPIYRVQYLLRHLKEAGVVYKITGTDLLALTEV